LHTEELWKLLPLIHHVGVISIGYSTPEFTGEYIEKLSPLGNAYQAKTPKTINKY
jgi:hypothetical protein